MTDITVRFATAAEWGMTWLRPPVREAMPDADVVIHHVGGTAWMNDDAFTAFRQLNRTAHAKGHSGVDYDMLGHWSRSRNLFTIGVGNGEYRSAATLDYNELGEALLMCGNYELRQPVPEEIEGCARMIVRAVDLGLVRRVPRLILGHHQNPAHPDATLCPGKFFKPHLPTIRTRAYDLLNPTPDQEDFDMLTLTEINGTTAVPDAAAAEKDPRWFNAVLLKVGAIIDVQKRHGLPVTGRYDPATVAAYNEEIHP